MTVLRLSLLLVLLGCSNKPEAALWELQADGDALKRVADGVLLLTSFTLLPDVTTSSLTISDDSRNNPGLAQTALGGGFTVSDDIPLYLEGNLGWSRFDPEFVASDGTESRRVPVKWNSFTLTGGIGWDFDVGSSSELKFRPILSFTLGRTTTDAALLARFLESEIGANLEAVDKARMDAYGLGGGLMLDYERYRETYEVDVELRYSNIQLRTFGATTDELQGESESNTAGLWARWRAPTGLTFLQRPMRYVLETSHTRYYGDQRGALGFDYLTSLGVGLEVDSTAYTEWITRTRLVGRYVFGNNVKGASVGIAVSF